ncbi:MAG TPA: peptidase S41, partial [Cyclobacteriaceae bacterium]|nr:peptidase S41 [Cyclobacteriaceae bacterium]
MSENQNTEIKNTRNQIRLPLILFIGLAAGVFVGANFNRSGSKDVGQDVQKFKEVLTQIKESYVDDVNTSDLVDDAIQQMLAKLDPHSAYIKASDRERANEDLRGNF